MCNSPGIMKFSSHQNTTPRSGSSKMESVTCQNGYRPSVHTILHGVALLIMIGWQHLLCKPSMIPPCHLGIQNLHIHWRYLSGSGIYSHMVRHFTDALPSAAKRLTVASVLFTVTSSRGNVNHVFTIMTLPHSLNSEIFIAPEQYIFHGDGEHR